MIVLGTITKETLSKLKERISQKVRLEDERKKQARIAEFQAIGAKRLIEKTIPYVAEESKEGYIELVHNNSRDLGNISTVKMTSELIIAIGKGMPFDKAIRIIADRKHGTSGFALGWAAKVITHCSVRGEEFRNYWNGLYGIPEEEKGVVNPAILVVSKKKR